MQPPNGCFRNGRETTQITLSTATVDNPRYMLSPLLALPSPRTPTPPMSFVVATISVRLIPLPEDDVERRRCSPRGRFAIAANLP